MPVPWSFLRAGELCPDGALKVRATCKCAIILISTDSLAVAAFAFSRLRTSSANPHRTLSQWRSIWSACTAVLQHDGDSIAWDHPFHAQYWRTHLGTPFMSPVRHDICVPCVEQFVHDALSRCWSGNNICRAFEVRVCAGLPVDVLAGRVDHVLAMNVRFSRQDPTISSRVDAVALCLTTTEKFAFMVGSFNVQHDPRYIYAGAYVILGSSVAEVVKAVEGAIEPGLAVWYLDNGGRFRLSMLSVIRDTCRSNCCTLINCHGPPYCMYKLFDDLERGLHRLNDERRYARDGNAYTFGEFVEWYMYQQLLNKLAWEDSMMLLQGYEEFVKWCMDPDHTDKWEVHKFDRFRQWLELNLIIPQTPGPRTLWRYHFTDLKRNDLPYSFGEHMDWYSGRVMKFWEEAPPAEGVKLKSLLST